MNRRIGAVRLVPHASDPTGVLWLVVIARIGNAHGKRGNAKASQ